MAVGSVGEGRYLGAVICRVCGVAAPDWMCSRCEASLQAGLERRLASGLLVRTAFLHRGAARTLVHHLKYGGPCAGVGYLARAMAGLVPRSATCLVPVPRVLLRTWRYGADPALLLTKSLSLLTGLPMLRAIRRPAWWAPRAGPAGAARGRPRFGARAEAPPGAVLVDDVLTSGATLSAAHLAVPAASVAVTATVAPGSRCRLPPSGV